ncbi:DgyrCDS12637 [Dimorphilus gyrociliatus]|uniref:Eukaryotic translation initiation factor 3 subunit D n=1 Tax=Dimorphilus gyrociliatus TaxID=2664684 RepID=A0A7I8W8D4_9ANNE|nr:DgyrCDS12637 [Dimorphilus gyrociliatus]
MAKFVPPIIQDNPDGWGPCTLPEQFKDMPYQPFSKGDRLGKVADWYGSTYQDRRILNKYQSQFGANATQYAYYHEEDESSFQLVDTTRQQKSIYQRNRVKYTQYQKMRKERERRQLQQQQMQVLTKSQKSRERDRQRQIRKWQKQYGRQMQDSKKNYGKPQQKNREASVQVRESWKFMEDMDFPRLAKLSLPTINEPEDLKLCGSLEFYDKSYDRITTKSERRLNRINRVFHKVTTTEDPIIRKLAKQGNVFATDSILATIMCCTRSVYSWDIVVQKVKNKLFLDKRDDSNFDQLTVNETATETPQEEGLSINSPHNLAMEAAFINHNFSQQVLKMSGERHQFKETNPFEEETEGDIASVAYKYRKWDLGNNIELVARCEVDAVTQAIDGSIQQMSIKALNEWDSKASNGVDWRSRLDNQRGAVLATELKNNSCKLAKWTVGALLSGSDQIKFGYVSRLNVRDSARHVILGTQQFKPAEFANQINLKMDNCWGILRVIIDTCMKLDDGKYLIMKDPNKPTIRIYKIPASTFESDDDEDEEGDDDDSDSDDDSDGADSDDSKKDGN